MTENTNVHTEWIRDTVRSCQFANGGYLHYLKRYAEDLLLADRRKDMRDKESELRLTLFFEEMLGKSTARKTKQLNDLTMPGLHSINSNLDDIYSVIDQALTIRGWPRSKPTGRLVLKELP